MDDVTVAAAARAWNEARVAALELRRTRADEQCEFERGYERARVGRRGQPIAVDGCIGFDLRGVESPQCTPGGRIAWCEKVATAWGAPFVTHAWMCERHRDFFGYSRVEPQPETR